MAKRKVSAIALMLAIFSSVLPQAMAEGGQNESIYNEIQQLREVDYNVANQSFTMLDLKPYATRHFMDEVEGDGTGGWSDQGTNDCRDFTARGKVEYFGIPFNIIDPDKNNGKSVVVLRGQNDKNLPAYAEFDVGVKAAGAYFIHTLAYGTNQTIKLAEYTFMYEDGTSATMDVYEHEHICDFWQKHEYETYRTTWSVNRAVDNREVSMGMLAVTNPYPDKVIDKIRVESINDGAQAYIMVIAVTLTNKGPYLPYVEGVGDKVNPATISWIKHNENDTVIKGTPLDSSYLLDKPAGKHGRLVAQNGEFVFENGEKIKFWGTNLTLADAFYDKEKASAIADDIAMCGFNIVRFNDVDMETLTSDKKDALLYLIAELKQRGIYTYLCMNTSAEVKDFVNDESISSQKETISAFMTETNPYTGLTLAEEPAIAMVELLSNVSLTNYIHGFGKNALSKDDAQKLTEDFNEWLSTHYKDDVALKNAWTGKGIGVNEGESLAKKNVALPGFWKTSLYSENRKLDTHKFLMEKQESYYAEMKECIKNTGYAGVVTCNSNELMKSTTGDAYVNSKTDFIARNVVWNESYGSPYVNSFAWLRNDGPMFGDENLGIIGEIADSAYENVPMVVSEWSVPFCNMYSAEAYVMMATYGAKQSWNPIAYTYVLDEPSSVTKMTDFYSIYRNPSFKALSTAGARLYHSIEKHQKENTAFINDKIMLGTDYPMPETDITTGSLRLKYKNDAKNISDAPEYNTNRTEDVFVNYSKGNMMVDNEYALAFAGKVDGKISFSTMEVDSPEEELTLILTSNDGSAIKEADSLLLTVAGNSRNKGMKISEENITSDGFETILSEAKECRIRIKLNGKFQVYGLEPSGERKLLVPSYRNQNDELVFTINKNLAKSDEKALCFEIVRSSK